jgi:hypothetical protein
VTGKGNTLSEVGSRQFRGPTKTDHLNLWIVRLTPAVPWRGCPRVAVEQPWGSPSLPNNNVFKHLHLDYLLDNPHKHTRKYVLL